MHAASSDRCVQCSRHPRHLGSNVIFAPWEDLEDVLESIAATALAADIDAVRDVIPAPEREGLRQEVGEILDHVEDTRLTSQVKLVASLVVQTFLESGYDALSSTGFLDELETRVDAAGSAHQSEEEVLTGLEIAFRTLGQELGPYELRRTVLPLLHLFAKLKAEHRIGGGIHGDYAVEVLARIFCNRILVRPFYSDRVAEDLDDLLARAQAFRKSGDVDQREGAMNRAFRDFRGDVMDPLNGDAWQALEAQSFLDDWEAWIDIAQGVLSVLDVSTVVTCVSFQEFCTKIDDVNDLIVLLDSLRVTTEVTELAVAVNAMEQLSGRVGEANEMLFPTP